MLAQSVRRALSLRDDELSAQVQLADYVGGRVPASEQVRVIAFLRELPISLDGHTAEQAWSTIAALAERRRLTLYDAAYLELALRTGLPLATLDADLKKAAQAAGVEPFAPN